MCSTPGNGVGRRLSAHSRSTAPILDVAQMQALAASSDRVAERHVRRMQRHRLRQAADRPQAAPSRWRRWLDWLNRPVGEVWRELWATPHRLGTE